MSQFNELIFDVMPSMRQGEPLKIGHISIPRYGSPTVEETLLLNELAVDCQSSQLNNMELVIALATVLMQCRHNKNWTAKETVQLPMHQIEAMAEFLLGEKQRWAAEAEHSEVERSGIKKPSIGIRHG